MNWKRLLELTRISYEAQVYVMSKAKQKKRWSADIWEIRNFDHGLMDHNRY